MAVSVRPGARLTAAATLGFLGRASRCRIHSMARALYRRFQLIGGGQVFVVLHRGFARCERHVHVSDSGNRLQRTRNLAGAAAASHAGYVHMFGLHGDISFHRFDSHSQALRIQHLVYGVALGVRRLFTRLCAPPNQEQDCRRQPYSRRHDTLDGGGICQ